MITNEAAWGIIPQFISPHNTAPLWQQIHEFYAHGGGWNDFNGFTVTAGDPYTMTYPGDPPLVEIGRISMNDQLLILFPHSWVLWTDGTDTKVARID